jgi:lipopolysaccharide transport system permease protein
MSRDDVSLAQRDDPRGDVPPTAHPQRPTIVIEPTHGWLNIDFASLWSHRELLYFLVWRDIRVRYKQTVIGVAWAVLQPFLTMLIFVVVFGVFARFPSNGVPYPIFAYAALLPWYAFSQASTSAALSLVSDGALLKKVYFPRLLIPLAAVIRPLVDFLVSFVLLFAMMVWYGIPPGWSMAAAPFFLLLSTLTALAVGLWLAPIHLRFRDVGHTFAFLIQVWLFASPVAYSLSLVPERWQFLYSLNPMVGVIEGFRWAVLGTPNPPLEGVAMSVALVLVGVITGLVFFRRMERTFADVV